MNIRKAALIAGIFSIIIIVFVSSWMIVRSPGDENATRRVYYGTPGVEDFAAEELAEQELNEILEKELLEKIEINFINLGTQDAEAILVRTKENTILIDAGNNEARKKLSAYLSDRFVEEIDLFILTNSYIGHVGGADNLLDDFKVNKIWENGISSTILSYRSFSFKADQKTERQVVLAGEKKFFGNLKLEVLSPFEQKYGDSGDDSVIVKLTYEDFSVIFMSNCKTRCEKGILDSGADVSAKIIKIGDYGSAKATTPDFIEAVNPEIAIVTGRSFDQKTRNTLQELGVNYYEVMDGSVTIVSDGISYEIKQ